MKNWPRKVGWLIALAALGLAVFLATRIFALNSTVARHRTEIELAKVEVQSLQQQRAAERILTTQQITDLKKAAAQPFTVVFLREPQITASATYAWIVWHASLQRGVFIADKLPPLSPGESYQLWIDNATGQRVSAGAIEVAPEGSTQVKFSASQPVTQAMCFTLSREPSSATDATGQPTSANVLSGTP